MDSFAAMIRRLREEKKAPLRKVAAYIDIDQAILSKLESGKHHASPEQTGKADKRHTAKRILMRCLPQDLPHSDRSDSTGLAKAALVVCMPTVNRAIPISAMAAIRNVHTSSSIL